MSQMLKNITYSKDRHNVKFELHGVHVSIANAIRRVLLVEIPIIAIDRDSISFRAEDNNINTSNFHDQFLIHRLSFVRLKIDHTKADPIKFDILIANPDSHDLPFVNSSDDHIDFTSNDLIVTYDGQIQDSSKIFIDNFLIARLKPGQQLKATMAVNQRAVRIPDLDPSAILAKTRYHYQPCRIKFCYKTPHHDNQTIMTPDDELRYYGHEQKTPKAFVFEICSFKSPLFSPQNLMQSAFEVILEKLQRVKQLVENKDNAKNNQDFFSLNADPVLNNTLVMRLSGEGHTLGNMLAEQMRTILQKQFPSDENFISYQKVHPLEEALILKIKLSANSKISHSALIGQTCSELADIFHKLEKFWHH